MICVLALIVFAALAVFSARYRPLAAEAFDCVFRRITFRKCRSRLDQRLKSQLTGKVMRRHQRLGRFLYRYFEVFSWLLLLLLLLSLVQAGISAYNLVVYGNCYGLDDEGFCVFDPLANGREEVSLCTDGSQASGYGALNAPSLFELAGNPRTGSAAAPVTVVEFGCFACPNTAEQAPAVKRLIEHFGREVQFVYVDFPLSHHDFALEASLSARCVYEQDPLLYWHYHFLLFQEHDALSVENLRSWAGVVGTDLESYDACLTSDSVRDGLEADLAVGHRVGIYGTPTFFIDGEPIVGVKSYRFLKAKIDSALEAKS